MFFSCSWALNGASSWERNRDGSVLRKPVLSTECLLLVEKTVMEWFLSSQYIVTNQQPEKTVNLRNIFCGSDLGCSPSFRGGPSFQKDACGNLRAGPALYRRPASSPFPRSSSHIAFFVFAVGDYTSCVGKPGQSVVLLRRRGVPDSLNCHSQCCQLSDKSRPREAPDATRC